MLGLPDALGYCRSLAVLDLSYNDIAELPVSLSGLKALTDLSAAHNRLHELSGKIFTFTTALKSLNASFNALREVNGSLYTLRRLAVLDLSHNGIEELDGKLGALVNLSSLKIAFNAIRELPPEVAALKVGPLLLHECIHYRHPYSCSCHRGCVLFIGPGDAGSGGQRYRRAAFRAVVPAQGRLG